jgi:hypothetical protein
LIVRVLRLSGDQGHRLRIFVKHDLLWARDANLGTFPVFGDLPMYLQTLPLQRQRDRAPKRRVQYIAQLRLFPFRLHVAKR